MENYYEYPAGKALSIFLSGLKQGKIIASECTRCGGKRVPPRAYCMKCLSASVRYVDTEPIATIETFTKSRLNIDGKISNEEKTWVFVKFINTDGGIIHLLEKTVQPRIGMKVRPVFQTEKIGHVWDIKDFIAVD